MKSTKMTFRRTALSAACLAAFNVTWADQAEVDVYSKPDSSVSIGLGGQTRDRQQLGMYDGLRDSGAKLLLDADVSKRDEATGTWFNFRAKNLGFDNPELRGEVLRQGDIGGYFEYDRITRFAPYNVLTGLQGVGAERQIVGGAAPNAFPKRELELSTARDLYRFGFYKSLAPGLEFKVDFKNEFKSGERTQGYGANAYFLTEPINSEIRQLETILQYSGKSLQLSGGYYGSWYDQHTTGMITATTNPSATATYLSLPLSNQAHQGFLDGGYSFTPTTRGTFKLAYSAATQDEVLPTSLVTGLSLRPGAQSLGGEVNTTLVQLGLSSRPLPKLSVNVGLRYFDLNDKTPVRQYQSSGTSQFNTPHSFTKTSGKVEATYRLPADFSLLGGIEYVSHDRSSPQGGPNPAVPYRNELNELTYRLQLKRSLGDAVNGSLAYLHSERDGSTILAAQSNTNPMHIADRKRDKLRARLEVEPIDKLSLQFTAEGALDDYGPGRSSFGLLDGESWLYSVDANYTLSEKWALSAWYAYEDIRSKQLTQLVNTITLGETSNSVGFGVRGKVSSRLQLNADLDWMRIDSKHGQSASTTANTRLPDIQSSVARIRLNSTYSLSKQSDVRVDFVHERWSTNDWTWTFANGSAYCSSGTSGSCTGIDGTFYLARPVQASEFLGVRYIYKF